MKEIEWPFPYGYTIFCDDIRTELGNKLSLMGCYSRDLFVPFFPCILPKFSFLISYFEDPKDFGRFPLEVRIFLPENDDDNPFFRVQIPLPPNQALKADDLEQSGLRPRAGITLPITLTQLPLLEPGAMRVRMARGDDEIVRLGALMIKAGAVAEMGGLVMPANPSQDTPGST